MVGVRSIIAIDPGYARGGKGCAVAEFLDARLVRVYFARAESACPPPYRVDVVAWEIPTADARSRAKDANVLIRLAAAGASLAGVLAQATGATIEAVTPVQWKGATAKPVQHARMWRSLDAIEHALLGGDATLTAIRAAQRKGALDRWGKPGGAYYPASFATHNLLDAVGIGMWRLGR